MIYEELKKDKLRFQKIQCDTLLELALRVPKKYENYFLSTSLDIGNFHTINCIIKQVVQTRTTLQIHLLVENFNISLNYTVFNAKSFHRSIYKLNSNICLYGKIDYDKNNILCLTQSKQISSSNLNTIYTKYNSTVEKNLIKKYINNTYLKEQILDENIRENIIKIHNPDKNFIDFYNKDKFQNKNMKSYLHSLKYIEILNYKNILKSKKKVFKSKKVLDYDISTWIDKLPFKLTDDQQNALLDIQKDFKSNKATRRIIVGDVGCGKSLVIFASALMAYPNKVLLMAPTTILAQQLYDEANKFLKDYLDIELITSKSKEFSNVAHFTIGTQALLFKDFKDIDLIMIDEQHKFGSNQREQMQKIINDKNTKNNKAHFLQFTATPIPRSMAMLESKMIDFSFIKQTPFKKNIQTIQIQRNNFAKLLHHINEQIALNNQIAIIYPLVNESEKIDYLSLQEAQDFWIKRYKKVYITSGQDKQKEEIIDKFRIDGNILLSTTMLEVGVSLERLSTIVIVAPERLGLASLHQLRGRVSRNGKDGFCFLFSNQKSKRLDEFSALNSGFDIAELDLKYRQAGDIISGIKQSGKTFAFASLYDDKELIKQILKD